jgi:hypothetical protein
MNAKIYILANQYLKILLKRINYKHLSILQYVNVYNWNYKLNINKYL